MFAQYQQLLAEHQPDLVVKGDNYPPPGFRWQKLIFHGKYSCTYQYPMKSPESLWHSCRQRFIYHNCYVNRLQFAHLIGALKMALLLMLVISFDPWAYIGHEVTPPSPHIIVQEHHPIYAQSDNPKSGPFNFKNGGIWKKIFQHWTKDTLTAIPKSVSSW